MMNWWPRRLTLAQLAADDLLAQLADLPVGESIVLPDRTGAGDLLVKRQSKYTLVFQRTQKPKSAVTR